MATVFLNGPPPWDPGSPNVPPKVPAPTGNGPTPPPVPGGGPGGGRHTSVDTASLDVFAKNIGLILQPIKDAMTNLLTVNVQPGAFYHADLIRAKVDGAVGSSGNTGGIRDAYNKVIYDLLNSLMSLQQEVQAMSVKYKNISQLNTITATDLQNSLNGATGY